MSLCSKSPILFLAGHAIAIHPALASGCWKSPEGHVVQVGVNELVVSSLPNAKGSGDIVCEIGAVEGSTYLAGCIDDADNIGFISVTEEGDTATVIWDEGQPVTYGRCPD